MRALGLFVAMLAAAGFAAVGAHALGTWPGTPAIVFLVVLYALIRWHRARVDERIARDLRNFDPAQREHLLSGLRPRARRRILARLARMER